MYQALADSNLKNTSVILANTVHPAIEKFGLPKKLGVQRVHQYAYQDPSPKNPISIRTVTVRHHNGVDRNIWTCDVGTAKYQEWLQDSKFRRTVAAVKSSFHRVPDVLTSTPKDKNQHRNLACYDEITPFQRQLVEVACKWAAEGAAAQIEVSNLVMAQPLQEDVVTIAVGQRYWALKKNLPAVRMPLALKKLLIKLYNRVPHVSPESAVTEIQQEAQFKDNIFVRYMATSARVKTYFATLKSKKEGTAQKVPESAAASDVVEKMYGGVREMKALIKQRNIQVVGGVSRMKAKELEDVLADDDKSRAAGDQWDTDAVAQEMATTAARYDLDECTSDATPELASLVGYTLEELLESMPIDNNEEVGLRT